ncbi:MAG: 4-hydroxy-tetrahydrodipicolinate reductase [Bacteroidetes bacterium]|nr:4-hydroxy-tetrahydrodipicolinate reductase [Bacteroidota bacterium]
MRIALVGYGKMGHAIEEAAIARGHEVTFRIDQHNMQELDALSAENTDVCIEFTHPDAVLGNLKRLIPKSLPLVIGTTGWESLREDIRKLTLSQGTGLVHASNFSLGMNVMFRLNKELARIMDRYPQYDVFVEDQHHAQKKDSPSGTALSLAQQIVDGLARKTDYVNTHDLARRAPLDHELSISSVRAGKIVGIHQVSYTSDEDTITLKHEAHNRNGFAVGAVIAAELIAGRKGFFEFSELLWDE